MVTSDRRTWAEFMEDALYDPERGFFSRSPVGAEFATAPHLSPVFAACVARLIETAAHSMGDPFAVVEFAAADGTLAEQIAASAPEIASRIDYLGIDRDQAALARLGDRAPAWRSMRTATVLREPVRGLVFANELFDNIPFHRLRGDREIFVESRNGLLVEVEDTSSADVLAAAGRVPAAGEEIIASPQARALIREIVSRLEAGWFVAIDYCGVDEPVRGYRGHARVDPLTEPEGSCDITGPVDLVALADEARAGGARVTLTDQARLLRALGFETFLAQLEQQQVAAQQTGEVGRAMLIQQVRDGAQVLVDPGELGAFGVLIAAVGDVADLPVPLG